MREGVDNSFLSSTSALASAGQLSCLLPEDTAFTDYCLVDSSDSDNLLNRGKVIKEFDSSYFDIIQGKLGSTD